MLDLLWEMRYLMEIIARDNAQFPELLPEDRRDYGRWRHRHRDRRPEPTDGCRARYPSRPADVVATIMLMAAVGYTRTTTLFGQPIANVDREEFGRVLTDLVLGRPSA